MNRRQFSRLVVIATVLAAGILAGGPQADALPGDDPQLVVERLRAKGWTIPQREYEPANFYGYGPENDWRPIGGRTYGEQRQLGFLVGDDNRVATERLSYFIDWGYVDGDMAMADELWAEYVRAIYPKDVAAEILTGKPVIEKLARSTPNGEGELHRMKVVQGKHWVYQVQIDAPLTDKTGSALKPDGRGVYQVFIYPATRLAYAIHEVEGYSFALPNETLVKLQLELQRTWHVRQPNEAPIVARSPLPESDESPMTQLASPYAGIGVRLSKSLKSLWIMSVNEGGPAWLAGLQAGDRILAIDGRPASSMTIEQATGAIRGRSDTRVSLQVQRGKTVDVTIQIVRRAIKP